MITLVSLFLSIASATTFNVYVSPIKIVNKATNPNIAISHEDNAPYYYSSLYSRLAKEDNGTGGYDPVEKVNVYNKETIEVFYPECNYRRKPIACAVQNGHYYVETIVTLNDDQMIFRTTLYGPEGTIINTATRTDEMVVNWIRQQEVTVVETQTRQGKQTMTHHGKEEMPLKWEIPYKLLQYHAQQASMGLWLGVKLN
jgi:hypothetical protein